VSGWLLDANIVSELRRPRPEPRVLGFMESYPLESFFVGSVTLAEIRFGIELHDDPARRAELSVWLANQIRPLFENLVLPVTEDVMFRWRLLVEEGGKQRHTFSQADLERRTFRLNREGFR
jgi:predicted nucleic acid-binding protein